MNRCPIKNCKFKKRQRIKKRESERRRFVKRNKSLTLFKGSRVFCSAALRDWNCFSLIRFSLFAIVAILHQCIVHLCRLTSMHIYKKKRSGLSGFTRVGRVSPGQLPGGLLLRLGPIPCPGPGSQVDPPGRSRFQNYDICKYLISLCIPLWYINSMST